MAAETVNKSLKDVCKIILKPTKETYYLTLFLVKKNTTKVKFECKFKLYLIRRQYE